MESIAFCLIMLGAGRQEEVRVLKGLVSGLGIGYQRDAICNAAHALSGFAYASDAIRTDSVQEIEHLGAFALVFDGNCDAVPSFSSMK